MEKNKISDSYTVADLFENILNNDILLNKAGKNSELINLMKEIIDKNVLIVKPNLTLVERIAVIECKFEVNSINESNFPHDPTVVGKWEYRLINTNKSINSKDAKSLCEADGWQAARLEHLLAFDMNFPDGPKNFQIIALGSVCGFPGFRVPMFWYDDNICKLGLDFWGGPDWIPSSYFLSVRKISN